MRRLRQGPWSLSAEALTGFTGLVFVSDGRVVPVSFAVAASRLEELARGRLLDGVSERVYRDGVEYLLRVGPAGAAVPGFSRLVRVRFAEPVRRDGAVSVALRWEAAGAAGGLFPALDADIRLSGDGDKSKVTLTGSYRPPLGAFGERLDRFVLHTVATATIAALLARVAAALEGVPAPAAEPDMPWQPGLGPQPASG